MNLLGKYQYKKEKSIKKNSISNRKNKINKLE